MHMHSSLLLENSRWYGSGSICLNGVRHPGYLSGRSLHEQVEMLSYQGKKLAKLVEEVPPVLSQTMHLVKCWNF